MKTFANKSRKFLQSIFKGLSATSLAFTFQACYGTAQDVGQDVLITGTVSSTQTGEAIPGIKVSVEDQPQYEITDGSGQFSVYALQRSACKVTFEDADALQHGAFLAKDTIVEALGERIVLNVSLDAR
ncbi:MAG: carboxypeptidase-like regulatory domain-containing protein [Prevotellaceae bacterium]|nr:carboxypeptidase-like regulatory domain-containing protein [Prevotellaceae bacterium]